MTTLTRARVSGAVPALGLGYDVALALASVWMVAGLYWDGWAHGYGLPDSFWTIWHAAFYSGFGACVVAILAPVVLARPQAGSWRAAIPAGRGYAVAGVLVFAVGGVFDMLWHTAFGIEFAIDALVSPSHLLLGTGAALIVSAPFVAPRDRAGRGLVAQLPAVVSLTLLLGIFTFFTLFADPYTMVIGAGPKPSDALFVRSMLGVYLYSALATGFALVALRRATLPPGALTVMLGLNGVTMILMRGHAPAATQITFALVAIAGGLLGDALLRLLHPSADRLAALRVFAFALPAAYWALYLTVVAVGFGTGWTAHELAGIVFVSGIVGLLVSLVFTSGDARASASG